MSRRVQIEAMAITYLIGLPLLVCLVGLSTKLGHEMQPVTILLLEPIRGGVLVAVARRYR